MSQKEYQTISNFITGTLSENERKAVSNQIKSHSLKNYSGKIKTKERHIFNADKAWFEFKKDVETPKTPIQKRKSLYKTRNIAASVIILAVTTIFGYFLINNFTDNQFTEISSGNEIKEIVLPDGSVLTLNKNSEIRFPEEFSKINRSVEFSGEAFFEIKRNPKIPFVIRSNNTEITVLGTSFNVLTSKKTDITVTVKTGKIKLSNNNKENIILKPEEVGKIENNILSKSVNKNKNYLSWKTKCFNYNGEKLNKVIEDFNKAYNAEIVIEDPKIGKLPIVSNPRNKALTVALEIICSAHNLKYKQEKNKIIIYKD
ncbi:MAG: FecR family protein [Bacteroidales bacterium]|nr:FecR family protein [Bacteroidales bacterium]